MVCVRNKLALAALVVLVGCGGSEPGGDDPSGGAGATTGGTGATGGNGASGGNDATGGAGAPAAVGDLLPWKEGNYWVYRVTDGDGVVTTKRTTVGPLELVGGTGPNQARMAHRVTTHKNDTGDGAELDETVSWQGIEGERVVRYREQAYGRTTNQLELEEHWDPHKLHVDSSVERTTAGHTWLESYKETKLPAGSDPSYDAPTGDRWFVERLESVTVPAGTFDAVVLRKVSTASSNQKTYWYVPGVGKAKETGGQTEELVEYHLE